MITKEIENILKAFPNFLQMTQEAANPFLRDPPPADRLEVFSKAIWFIVPFHFLSFLGLVPLRDASTVIVLLAGFLSLLGLSWVGTLIGVALAVITRAPVAQRTGIVSAWVVALVTTWFYCVVILAVTNFWLWLRQEGAGPGVDFGAWPDLIDEVGGLLTHTALRGDEILLVSLGVPAAAALLLIGGYGAARRGRWYQALAAGAVCGGACVLFIAFTVKFLKPMAAL